MQQVLERSLEARILDAEAALGRAEAVGVGLWPNPTLEWERQPNPTEDRVTGSQHVVSASIPLVLSGRLGLEAEAATRRAKASEARVERARGELRLEASRAFQAVLAAEARRTLLSHSKSALVALADIIAARERAGEASGYDRLRIGLERAVVEDALRQATLEQERARAEALRLLGSGAQALPAFEGQLAPERPVPEATTLLASLEAQRADVRALGLEASAAQAAQAGASRGWIPDPSVTAGAFLLEGAQPNASTGYVVGLSLPLPLFERQQGPQARARASQQLAEARRAQLLQAARVQLSTALTTLSALHERMARHRTEVLAPAEELREVANEAYRGGAADLLALVDAERSWREAGLTDIDIRLAVSQAHSHLLFLSGAFDGAAPRSSSP